MPKTAQNSTEAEVKDDLSFEVAMKELEEIVRRLEGTGGDLESSIRDYLRGTALTQHCQKKLADARLRIESILKTEAGLALQPLESQSS